MRRRLAAERDASPKELVAAAVAASVLLQACGAGWRSQSDLAPGPVKPRQQAQVWHEGRAERWHALVISPDSVSGVPFMHPTDCDSCRVAFPRAQVDSIRFGSPVAGFWNTVGLALGISILAWATYCIVEHGGACAPGY